ncbi:GNAT family N-acetyltransferase [Miniphocaeibacter halophilus]|uniref:GNAT family N-acetyltransferase n=1 Tax=Miniphocaeibacter halophilus TaxID=2931922 RepID=A0AC61MSW6_9FIRM|nr:GNAT family N-acetyltransferase [Miniphocaeibacter halophilus]QQK08682.1 GNAT family N-acetyltransferase [Miniphocaeibacter halophilus]
MKENNLEIKIINSREELDLLWNMRDEYMYRDILSNDKIGLEITEKDREWLLSPEYRDYMEKLFFRNINKAYPVLLKKEKKVVGFCIYCTYHSEDGKCFIVEYCILPKYRGNKLGTVFFNMIKETEVLKGAKYFELNVSNKRNMSFWMKQGFNFKGIDKYGSVILTTEKDSILLFNLDENNWLDIISLKLSEEQLRYVSSPLGVLARGYIYRKYNPIIFGIQKGKETIGVLMVRDIYERPECYELQQFLIDIKYQNKGYGYKALKLILDYLYIERKYDKVEVCVKKDNTNAIKLYKKIDFIDTEYVDPKVEDTYNLVFNFKDLDKIIQGNKDY